MVVLDWRGNHAGGVDGARRISRPHQRQQEFRQFYAHYYGRWLAGRLHRYDFESDQMKPRAKIAVNVDIGSEECHSACYDMLEMQRFYACRTAVCLGQPSPLRTLSQLWILARSRRPSAVLSSGFAGGGEGYEVRSHNPLVTSSRNLFSAVSVSLALFFLTPL